MEGVVMKYHISCIVS